MNANQSRRILQAIAECDTFIEKEEKRSADLRPADVQKHLDFCRQHKGKLQAMLANI
jgi:hypothetical protein